ncbi:MAG: hypothetical protein HY096_00920 [Nitrospinae bacterium]|nr:hypothetical protein [Nitrospinota bacterium]
MKSEKKLIERLNKINDLQVPGFSENVLQGEVGQIAFHETSSEKWYQKFLLERVIFLFIEWPTENLSFVLAGDRNYRKRQVVLLKNYFGKSEES